MLIRDRKSLPWALFSALLLAVTAAAYFLDVYLTPPTHRPRGGSWPGLIFGSLGSLLIIITLLLSLRKRLRSWRVGRTYQWTQAHVWFGTISFPIILFHGAWHWGGQLTLVLMWVFTAVWISGIVGLIFQQYVPEVLIRAVPNETVSDQIEHVVGQLRAEAEALVEGAGRGRVQVAANGSPRESADSNEAFEAPELGNLRLEGESGSVATLTGVAVGARVREGELTDGRRQIRQFYEQQVLPLLQPRYPRRLLLAAPHRADAEFLRLRTRVPKILHETVDDLKAVVCERHQLRTQRRLQRVLHSWLLVHVPLSFVMFLLAIVHAIRALKYATLGGW